MRVRALDQDGDWTFGHGKSNYVLDNAAIRQNIQTRLKSFLNDCFFDMDAGIDWYNLLGEKNETGIVLAVRAVILQTEGVVELTSDSEFLDREERNLFVNYEVSTEFSLQNQQGQAEVGIA